MKSGSFTHRVSVALQKFAYLSFVLLSSSLRAATLLTWDSDPFTPGITEGPGTWDNQSANTVWFNGSANSAYIPGSDVVFGGGGTGTTSYEVNLSNLGSSAENVIANSITFKPGASYTIKNDNNSARMITVSSGLITVNVDATILTGFSSPSLTKMGSGTLTFANNSVATVTGPATISEGTLVMNRVSVVLTGDVTINGGTVQALQKDLIANSATVTLSAGKLDLTTKNDQITRLNMSGGIVDGTGTLLATSGYNLSGGTVNANLGANGLIVSGPVALNGLKGSGAVNINAGGVLTLGAGSSRLNLASPLTISGGGQLVLGGDTTVASIALDGTITGSGTLSSGSGINVSAGSVGVALVGNSASLTKSTVGTVVLSGNNSYAGQTTVSQGTLQIGAGGSSGTFGTGNVTISSGASVVLNRSDSALIVGNVISGPGKVVKQGAGTITLDAANTYTGGTTLTEGTLRVGRTGAIPTTGGITMNGSQGSPARLALNDLNVGNVGQLTLDGYGVIDMTKLLSGQTPIGPSDVITIASINYISGKLEIRNWTGQIGQQGYDSIAVPGGFTGNPDFLDNVQFYLDNGLTPIGDHAEFLNGNLVPVLPEPIDIALGIFGGAFVIINVARHYVKRRRQAVPSRRTSTRLRRSVGPPTT